MSLTVAIEMRKLTKEELEVVVLIATLFLTVEEEMLAIRRVIVVAD